MGCGASANIAEQRAARRQATESYTITIHDITTDRRQDCQAWSWEPIECIFDRMPDAPVPSVCSVLLGEAALDISASFEQAGVCDACVLGLSYPPGYELLLDTGGAVRVYGEEPVINLLQRIRSQHGRQLIEWSNTVTALNSAEQLWSEYHQQRIKLVAPHPEQTCEQAEFKVWFSQSLFGALTCGAAGGLHSSCEAALVCNVSRLGVAVVA